MEVNEKLQKYAEVINDLHQNWTPHPGQVKVGRAIFNDGRPQIFVQCGRKWGKTDAVIYFAWRHCLLNPNSACYYISPFLKQSKEIVWANNRIQRFGPGKYVRSINNSELRLTFTNNSFIKCDGSDNFEAYRGITPNLVIYDEFKDFRPEFHVAMEPNLAVHNAPLIIIGTPPEREGQYTQMAQEFSRSKHKAFFQMPSRVNPHISRQWLDEQKELLYARGEEDVWMREYEGKYVFGGANAIFPMLSKDLVFNHDDILKEIQRDRKKLKWYVLADPGTTTCFAVLFAAINPYTKVIYLLDEIYATDQRETTVSKVGLEIRKKKTEINERYEWIQYADEAAAWFMNEMYDRYEDIFAPTQKHLKKKEEGLSLIKDAMLYGKLKMSDRCEKMYWEMEQYVRDKNGKIPKEHDHLIDALRYLLAMDYYALNEVSEPKKEVEKGRRAFRISEDFPGLDDMGGSVYADIYSDDDVILED